MRPREAPRPRRTRDLAVPGAGAREQQVREVRARDEQDDARRREQHPERMLVRLAQHGDARVAWRGFERERLVERRAGGRIVGVIVVSKMPGEIACSCAVARSSVHPGLSRPIATSHQSVAETSRLPPLIAGSGAERHGDVEAAADFEAAEPGRRDADHLGLARVERQRPSDRARVAAASRASRTRG